MSNESEVKRSSWGPTDNEDGNKEFWASIKEPYDFIMGTHLIPDAFEQVSCKDHLPSTCTEMELSWDPEDVSPHYVWDYSEFLDQYNELYEWLIQVQVKLYSHSNPPDKNARLDQQEELRRRMYRRKLFVEQGEKVAQKYPASEEEIKWRVNYLKNKWEQLQSTLTPVKGRTEEISVELDLAHEEKLLRSWLGTMEGQIQPITCRLPRGCSLHALQERYKDNQILLKDIKAHGPILKSVVRQYERQTQSIEHDITPGTSSAHPPNPESCPYPLSLESPGARGKNGRSSKSAVPRRARSLEKRYHQVYLRSLEWHYYLEGTIINFKDQCGSCTTSESEDEPVNKCRKLSEAPFSSISSPGEPLKQCSVGWSEYEANSSETGSYIEDDYVMTSPEAFASRKNDTRFVEDFPKGIRGHPENLMVATASEQSKAGIQMESLNHNNNNNNNESYNIVFINANEKYKELQNGNRVTSFKKENSDRSQRSPTASSLTKVGKPAPNCGEFVCKHNDTDSDTANDEVATPVIMEKNLNAFTLKRNITRPFRQTSKAQEALEDEEVDQEDLQRIIDSAIHDDQDWLNSNLTTSDSEGSIDDGDQHAMNTCNKESILRLVSDAEDLVREPLKYPDHLSVRPHLKPLPLGMPVGKQRQVKHWLNAHCDETKSSRLNDVGNNNIQDSCDASGELTTGESDLDSNDSNKDGFDTSLATEKGYGGLLLSSDNTPTMENQFCLGSEEKLKLRGKKRQYTINRPWSLTDETKMFCNESKIPSSTFVTTAGNNVLSSSETALDRLETNAFKAEGKTIFSRSDPAMWNTSPNDARDTAKYDFLTSPAITPARNSSSAPSSQSKDKDSPAPTSSGSLRRRIRLRRRSYRQSLGTRTDSGSDDILSKSSRRKTHKHSTYSPYHSPSKSLSSESETVSGCPKTTKRLSLSGDGTGQSRTVMTSSTEKCLSDSSVVSKASQSRVLTKLDQKKMDLPVLTPKSDFSPRPNPASDQEASTHQEDASSLSEQAWDPFQENKYLSEPYSEDLDLDAERKLLDFGDDYRNFIDSDGSSFYGFPYRNRQSPPQRRMRTPSDSDSDSDLEDIHHVIAESKSQLQAMENMLENLTNQVAIGIDLEDVLTTAGTNLKFLQDILRHLKREAPKLNSDLTDLHSIVDRWEKVQSKAVDRQQQSAQFRQLQRQIKSLRLNMESVLTRCSSLTLSHTLESFTQIVKKIEDLKSLLCETETLRTDLSELNILVHRFASEMGPAFTPLKEEVAELYRLWDETHRRVNGELLHLENVQVSLRHWEEQKVELSLALQQDSEALKVIDAAIDSGKLTESISASVKDVAKVLNERRKIPNGAKTKGQILFNEKLDLGKPEQKKNDRLSDSGTSGYESCSSDDLSERERRLAYLRRLARELQGSLVPGSKAWNEVNATLEQAENELKELQDHCRMLLLKTTETLEPNSKAASRFSSNCKRRNLVREGKGCRSPRVERRTRQGGGGPRRAEWVYRVARAAVPFQIALMLLLCVACLLEPNCCDSVNTFNLSFTPQLRFVHGSPPV